MPKKVVWDLDSDDEIIVKMKEAKYTDQQIVERLISEGRTKYHTKTISSRWVRLKRVLAAHQDELLDKQLTCWHEGDVGLPQPELGTSLTDTITGRGTLERHHSG